MNDTKNGWAFEILETSEWRLSSSQILAKEKKNLDSVKATPEQVTESKIDNTKAINNTNKGLTFNKEEIKTLVVKADSLYFNEKYDEAEKLYLLAIAAFGKNKEDAVECCYNLAQIYSKQARINEAEELYRQTYLTVKDMVNKESLCQLIMNRLAMICQSTGRYAEAESLLIMAITKNANAELYNDIQLVENCLSGLMEHYENTKKLVKGSVLKDKFKRFKSDKFGYAI